VKPVFRRLLCAALAAALLIPPPIAFASEALGHDLIAASAPVGAGTALADGTFWSDSRSDFRQENYVVYTPSARVTPIVTCGNTTRELNTTATEAAALEARGYRVVAGINGDYYGTAHGVPLGSTMTEGVLRNANGDEYYAVGFRADGTALIGDPKLRMHTTVNGEPGADIFAFNHVRQSGYGIFLYDHRFNAGGTTDTSEPGVEVVCTATDGVLRIGGTLTLQVDEVLPETKNTPVEPGKFVLSANLSAGEAYTAPLLALQPGDVVTVSVVSEAGEQWNEVQNLVGAPEPLITDGTIRADLPAGSAPRTAIGQRADGTLIFYTIDGRQSGYSVGATLAMVAMRLAELGCVTAVALDGGGSTTLVATQPNESAARVVNKPSEGSLRAVSNHILLVAPSTPSGVPDHVWVKPSAARALPGAKITLTAAAVDTNYIPMDAAVSFAADAGSMDGNVLTLPAETGTVSVTASGAGMSGTASVAAVAPEWLTLYYGKSAVTSLTLAPEERATLTAKGYYLRLPLAGGNDCFTWRYEGEGVTVSPDGVLTAGKEAAAGTLTVSVAGVETSIPVNVAPRALKTLWDFESLFEPLTDVAESEPEAGQDDPNAPDGTEEPPAAPRLTLTRVTDANHVRFGRAGARIDYRLDGETAAVLPVRWDVGSGYNCVTLWVCGDDSAAEFSLVTDAGYSTPVPCVSDGWTRVVLALPAGASRITGISFGAEAACEGAVWLDQIVLSYDYLADDTAPAVSLALDAESGTLTGRVMDAVNGTTLPRVRLAFDGEAAPFDYDKRTGALTAAAPAADGAAHNVTLTALDAAGNLGRVSIVIPADEGLAPAFPDAQGHWAAGYIEYLKRAGISNGSDGGLYKPDDNISRQEFATMLYRYLAPEGDFSGVEMPFDDRDAIASWAADAARAMYALGVVNGSKNADGSLTYNPRANITRREAATMLGRLLEKGYAAPALPYDDADEVPAWAAEHVAVLCALGVFDDFAGERFDPAVPITRAEMAAMIFRLN